MPLYVDRENIATLFCQPVADAMQEIKTSMEGRAVTPSFALKLIQTYLCPLLSEEQRQIVDKRKRPTWDDIFMIYVGLGFESKNGGIVADVTSAIDIIYRYTLPAIRQFKFPNTVDITHFLDTCRFLNIQVQELRTCSEDEEFDLFRFCKYCWRLPAAGRQICLVHTSGDNHIDLGDAKTNYKIPGAERFSKPKEGRRQRELFERLLNQLLTAESIEFHESRFSAQIIPPSMGLLDWLLVRRPMLWDALAFEKKSITDSIVIDMLLDALHSPQGLPYSTRKLYETANARIKQHNFLIGPMLARVEAWLMARTELRSHWGGSRVRAGRKRLSSE